MPVTTAVAVGLRNQLAFGGNKKSPYNSDLLAFYKGDIVKKTDGYYLKDYSDNKVDGKLIGSFSQKFDTTAKTYCNLSTIATTINATASDVVRHEFIAKINTLNSASDLLIFDGGNFAASKGYTIKVNMNKIVVSISNGTTNQIITSNSIITPSSYCLFSVIINLVEKKITISIDGVSEEHLITLVGGTYGNTGTHLIGSTVTPASMDVIYYKVFKNGILNLYFAFENENSSALYNLATGNIINPCLAFPVTNELQDVFPLNVLYGFEVYKKTTAPFTLKYIAAKPDGSFISPIISGYARQGGYSSGAGFNYAETSIKVNESLTLNNNSLLPPFLRYFYNTNGSLITNILIYGNTKNESESNSVLSFLKYNRIRTVINIGDSIACGGGYPLVSELPSEYQPDQPLASIYDLASSSIQVLTKNNSDQIAYNNSFSHLLSFAKNYNKKIYICGKGVGGTTLYVDWKASPVATYVVDTTNTINAMLLYAIKDMDYPIFEVYCSLGHNDAAYSGDAVSTFGANLTALIAYIRNYINQNSEWHHLPPRRRSASTIAIADAVVGVSVIDNKVFVYNPELLTFTPDGVHPNTTGAIQQGIMFETKNHI